MSYYAFGQYPGPSDSPSQCGPDEVYNYGWGERCTPKSEIGRCTSDGDCIFTSYDIDGVHYDSHCEGGKCVKDTSPSSTQVHGGSSGGGSGGGGGAPHPTSDAGDSASVLGSAGAAFVVTGVVLAGAIWYWKMR